MSCCTKHHAQMGGMAQVSGVACLVGVQNNGNVKSEPKHLTCARIFNTCFLCSKLYLILLSLSWFLRWADFFAFFSQSCQPSAAFSIRLCTWLCKIRRASCTVLPFLRHQETSSRCHRVMHVSDILPGCEHKLTFLSDTAN